MSTVLATVGFHAEKVLYGLETAGFRYDEPTLLILICGVQEVEPGSFRRKETWKKKQSEAIETLRRRFEPRGKVEVHPVKEPFDLADGALLVRRLIRDLRPTPSPRSPQGSSSIVCDISGGPAPLQSATLLAAMIEGIPVHYSSLEAQTHGWLPIPRIPYPMILGSAKRQILEILSDRPHSGKEIARRLGRSPSTVTHHIEALEKSGLIEVESSVDRRKKVWRLTFGAKLLL